MGRIPPVGPGAGASVEQHLPPARQHLRAVRRLAVLHANDRLRGSPVRGDAQDALPCLADHDALWSPTDAECVVGGTERHGGAARDRNSLERLVAERVEGNRSAIRRKDGLVHLLVPFAALNRLRQAPTSIGHSADWPPHAICAHPVTAGLCRFPPSRNSGKRRVGDGLRRRGRLRFNATAPASLTRARRRPTARPANQQESQWPPPHRRRGPTAPRGQHEIARRLKPACAFSAARDDARGRPQTSEGGARISQIALIVSGVRARTAPARSASVKNL